LSPRQGTSALRQTNDCVILNWGTHPGQLLLAVDPAAAIAKVPHMRTSARVSLTRTWLRSVRGMAEFPGGAPLQVPRLVHDVGFPLRTAR